MLLNKSWAPKGACVSTLQLAGARSHESCLKRGSCCHRRTYHDQLVPLCKQECPSAKQSNRLQSLWLYFSWWLWRNNDIFFNRLLKGKGELYGFHLAPLQSWQVNVAPTFCWNRDLLIAGIKGLSCKASKEHMLVWGVKCLWRASALTIVTVIFSFSHEKCLKTISLSSEALTELLTRTANVWWSTFPRPIKSQTSWYKGNILVEQWDSHCPPPPSVSSMQINANNKSNSGNKEHLWDANLRNVEKETARCCKGLGSLNMNI